MSRSNLISDSSLDQSSKRIGGLASFLPKPCLHLPSCVRQDGKEAVIFFSFLNIIFFSRLSRMTRKRTRSGMLLMIGWTCGAKIAARRASEKSSASNYI